MGATIPRLWPGATVCCIASGPSLMQADVDYVRGKARVIVVNNGYQRAPWADALWATDPSWWREYPDAASFLGLKFSLTRAGHTKLPDVALLEETGEQGLELSPTGVRHGMNGGHVAINIAVHLGATRIVLLGYDCQPGPRGEKHWHEDHKRMCKMPFHTWLEAFATLVEPLRTLGIGVVNCTRDSALQAFPRMPLAEALPAMRESQVA